MKQILAGLLTLGMACVHSKDINSDFYFCAKALASPGIFAIKKDYSEFELQVSFKDSPSAHLLRENYLEDKLILQFKEKNFDYLPEIEKSDTICFYVSGKDVKGGIGGYYFSTNTLSAKWDGVYPKRCDRDCLWD